MYQSIHLTRMNKKNRKRSSTLHSFNGLLTTSRPDVFCKKSILWNFVKFTRKHLCSSFFFTKVAGLRPVTLLKKRLWHRGFCKFCEISKNTFSYRTPVAGSLYCNWCLRTLQIFGFNVCRYSPLTVDLLTAKTYTYPMKSTSLLKRELKL